MDDAVNQSIVPGKAKEADISASLADIPGLDLELGLAIYDGEEDIYQLVLRSFVSDARAVADKLRAVSRETLHDYYIGVHGLKGISANVGAVDVHQFAARLTSLAQAGDLDGVLSENEALIASVNSLVSDIEGCLGS